MSVGAVTGTLLTGIDRAVTAIGTLRKGETARLTIAKVNRAFVIRLAFKCAVRTVLILVECTVAVCTEIDRTGIKVVTSTFLCAPFVGVALNLCADITIILADNVRIDAGVEHLIADLCGTGVIIIADHCGMLAAYFRIAIILRARRIVVTDDKGGFTAFRQIALVACTLITIVAIERRVRTGPRLLVANIGRT